MINPETNHFLDYDLLEINPYEVYKSKREQQLAVFELSKGISDMLNHNDNPIFQKIYDDLENLCNNLRDFFS